MKKLLFLAALCCTMFANAQYLSDGALIQIGDTYMEENFLRAGDVPELKQGTMTYDPTNHVLTLTDVVIEAATSADYGLILGCPNMPKGSKQMEIRVVGTNYIKHSRSSGYTMLLGDGSYTITGLNGTLYVMSNAGIGMLLGCNDLTVKDGVCVFAGYSESGMQTRVGIIPFFAEPLLAIDCATFKAFGTEYCMSYLNPTLTDAEVEGEYVYDESVFTWKDGSDVLKNKVLTFKPTKNIFWWLNSNPEGGSVTVTKDGNPISNPYRYGEDESNSWMDIVATPNDGWEFAGWRTFNGAVETSKPSTKYGLPDTKLVKTGMLVAYFRQTEPAEPTKPWYILDNLADRVLVFSTLAASPEEVLTPIPDKTQVTQAVFAEGRLYYMDQTASDKVDFYSCRFDPAAGTMDDKQKVLSINTYKKFFALTYNIDERYFYAVARKNDEKQYLVKIDLNGYSIKEIGEIKNADTNSSLGIYLMAANRQGELYGILKAGETHNKEASPFRHGSMFCKISKETAAVTPVGWTGFYFESFSCAMAFDYKTGALIANSSSSAMPCLLSIDVNTGRGTRLQEYTGYCNGIFQMVPETRPVTVGVKSGDEDKGTAVLLESGKTDGRYMIGDEFDIEAFPKTKEFKFVQWSDGNTDNPRTVTLEETSPTTYTAEFGMEDGVVGYPIWINNKQRQLTSLSGGLNSGNCSAIISGSIEFDPETNTLTLNGLSVGSDEDALTIGDMAEDRLTLTVRLVNTSNLASYGMVVGTAVVSVHNADVTFCGNGDIGTQSYYNSSAFVLEQAHVTFDGVDMSLDGNEYGIYGINDAHVTFRGANMQVMGNNGAFVQVDEVELSYCSITAPTGAAFNETNKQVEDAGGIVKGHSNPVVIKPFPRIRCTMVGGEGGTFTITAGTDEFTDQGWFEANTEVTVTAVPADNYTFGYWTDDSHWNEPEHEDFKQATRTVTKTAGEDNLSAMFWYNPQSSATWYGVNDGKFVAFDLSDHGAAVAKATFPDGANVQAGDFDGSAWIYQDGNKLMRLSFSGITDGKKIVKDASEVEELLTLTQTFTDMAYDFSKGVMYGLAGGILYRIDYKGDPRKVVEIGVCEHNSVTVSPVCVAVDGSSRMYLLAAGDPGCLYVVSEMDEVGHKVELERVGTIDGLIGISGCSLAFDHLTGELLLGAEDYLYVIDHETAKRHIAGDLGNSGGAQKMIKGMHRMDRLVKVTVKVDEDCEGMGSVSVNKSKVFAGTKVTIKAEPADGCKFVCWKRKGSEMEIGEKTYSFSAESNVTYVATFKKASGLDEVSAVTAGGVRKVFSDGTVYILRDGRIYDMMGRLLR